MTPHDPAAVSARFRRVVARAMTLELSMLPYRPVVHVGTNLDDTWHLPVAEPIREPATPKDRRRR